MMIFDKEDSLNVLINIVIICFIKYELDQFELNRMNVYVWYDVTFMFVNDMICDHDIISSRKKILC